MTNSQSFIDSYNKADKALHARFGFKPSMSFSDCVRRAASINAVVRKFEDDLIDFGRLRNSIVHRSNSAMTIAEPHDDVTERFAYIAEIISTPPLASSICHTAETVKAGAPLKAAVSVMSAKGFSNMPVTDGKKIVGMLTNKVIVTFAAKHIDGLQSAFDTAVVADALGDSGAYFDIIKDCPVDEVLSLFEKNRRMSMLIITSDGTAGGKIVGVITVGDLITVSKMLDGY